MILGFLCYYRKPNLVSQIQDLFFIFQHLSGMAETCQDLSLRLGVLLLEQNDHSVDVKGVGRHSGGHPVMMATVPLAVIWRAQYEGNEVRERRLESRGPGQR